jgi:hypothetical protein
MSFGFPSSPILRRIPNTAWLLEVERAGYMKRPPASRARVSVRKDFGRIAHSNEVPTRRAAMLTALLFRMLGARTVARAAGVPAARRPSLALIEWDGPYSDSWR